MSVTLAPRLANEDTWRHVSQRLQLSDRQQQIVAAVIRDEDEATIAASLGISTHTVHSHVERLYRKLAVSSRCQLLLRLVDLYIELS